MSTLSLTGSLLADPQIADLYRRATQTRFLLLAGKGRLPRETLGEWLSQDRLAALQWRILNLLQTCLAGIMREISFFEETASSYDIDLASLGVDQHVFGPNETTRGYIDLFDSYGTRPDEDVPSTLIGGLLVLWATEEAYLAAWSYAKQQGPQDMDFEKDLDGGATRKHFIPSWTSRPFQDFVAEIRDCLDAYAESLLNHPGDGNALFEMAAAMAKRVLALEENFWPRMAEDEVV
ncbi:putative transcription regulator [Rosellinia necatrix]|uniref:Putative transcription regulator n=1 Tax=Rosellinia necatrix TaxID=77044 RepID=A0A1W2TDH7_ROSNE|nr:putative transcription regulator [Rosellinia necatrix]